MPALPDIAENALHERLAVMGAFHTAPDGPVGHGTMVLLGPKEPGFWGHVTAAPEFADGAADPLDRWSRRIITAIAEVSGGEAFFPFGTPQRPFFNWALASGHAWMSPVQLLVHDTAGLMVSYRGAVLVPQMLVLPPPPTSPCETCATRPCLSACPVGALDGDGYALAACHSYLDTPEGRVCMDFGCAARRACPISQGHLRDPAQSAYHMSQFH